MAENEHDVRVTADNDGVMTLWCRCGWEHDFGGAQPTPTEVLLLELGHLRSVIEVLEDRITV